MSEPPVLPYAGTSGHSGSETSQRRAEDFDAKGITALSQQDTMLWLMTRGTHGGTQAELQAFLDVGHGTASQVLSNLHQAGHVARLTSSRRRSLVYVLPQFVAGRQTSDYRRLQSREALRSRIAELEEHLGLLIREAEEGQHSGYGINRARTVLNNRLEDR